MLENVASMSSVNRSAISARVDETYRSTLHEFDADEISPVRRPRRYWLSWTIDPNGPLQVGDAIGNFDISNPSKSRPPVK
eukprot:10248862-Karenia_brevis.AAC.1